MSRYKKVDLAGIRTISIHTRKSKVAPRDFARPFDPISGTFSGFIDSLPNILVGKQLRSFADEIVRSRRARKPVVLMMGGHVIKTGLAPVIVDLMEQGIITHVAMNSAASIHDVESAMWGHTSEDVAVNILDGVFGMSRETGEFINGTLAEAFRGGDSGYGEALGARLIAARAKYRRKSILAMCYELGIPATVHAAIGTDIIHQQPTMDGAATGEMSFRDFRIFAHTLTGMTGGGVVINAGSAVIMPEVFLKALTVVRNLGFKAQGFATGNFDMLRHYRPTVNVVERPTQQHGRGYSFTGHHEIMIPLLAAMVKAGSARRKRA